ncbi:MAG: acyl-homoserine-lactone synthase [Candidatus Buchananbacteria bacterium]
MQIFKTISLKLGGESIKIEFGIPNNDYEKDQMFKFRYDSYLRHDYIDPNENGRDVDEFDNGKSTYFIAIVGNKIIGTVRLIKDNYLPTEKDFIFSEPHTMAVILRDRRAELSRLIVERYDSKVFIPRHLVLLGLLDVIVEYALKNNLEGGYSFIKNSLKVKLKSMNFPFYLIDDFKKNYDKGVLLKYFNSKNDKVYPIYFVTLEIKKYIDRFFSNTLLFRRVENNHYYLRHKFLYNILIKINAL